MGLRVADLGQPTALHCAEGETSAHHMVRAYEKQVALPDLAGV